MSEQTNRQYNLDIYDPFEVVGSYDMPVINKTDHTPKELLGFNWAMSSKRDDVGIHFFLDDYQFERLWRQPQTYIATLGKFDCVLTPDFSLYTDMPKVMMIWNVYRSRLLGHFWQENGMTVIPTVSWADEDSFDFCFDGLPKHATVAVSTVGVVKNKEAREIWNKGFSEMLKRVKPAKVLLYGGDIDYDFPKNLEIVRFQSNMRERFKNLDGDGNGRTRS